MTQDQPKRNRGGETIKTCSCKAYKLEIERLEEEAERFKTDYAKLNESWKKEEEILANEIDALKQKHKDDEWRWKTYFEDLGKDLKTEKAKVERLREAIRGLVGVCRVYAHKNGFALFENHVDIAEEALQEAGE